MNPLDTPFMGLGNPTIANKPERYSQQVLSLDCARHLQGISVFISGMGIDYKRIW